MRRAHRHLIVAVAIFLVATVTPAKACSCPTGDDRDALARADAAIIGTLISRSDSGGYATFRFTIDEEIKGDFAETVRVWKCQRGILLRPRRKGWATDRTLPVRLPHQGMGLVSVPADTSRRSTGGRQTHAAPDGEGPIKMIVGGNWGEMGFFALDSEGRTLKYGQRPGGSSVGDVCPGSTHFLEVPWTGKRRWVVRKTSTFEIVDVVYPPRGAWPEQCLADDASRVLVPAIHYDEPISKSKLYRYEDGEFHLLYEGTSSGFEVVGERVYLTEGRYGRKIRVLDLTTGTKSFVARVPRYAQGVAVSPDETHLVTTTGADREKLISIDMTTSPATVQVKVHGIGRSGETYWIDNTRFVYLPGGYDNSKAKVFDADLALVKTFEGWWYTLDEEVTDGAAYGAGWGFVFRAVLPGGPAEVLREFPSSEIYSLSVVNDEVYAQDP